MEIKNRNEVNVNSNSLDNVRGPKNNPYAKSQAARDDSQAVNRGQDTVTVSNQSRTLFQASKILDQDSVARREKIDGIKARIQSGSYNVESDKVASSIVSYLSDEAKVGNF